MLQVGASNQGSTDRVLGLIGYGPWIPGSIFEQRKFGNFLKLPKKVKDDEIFQKGLMALRKSPHQDFQFNLRQEGALEEYGRWFNGDDSVKMLCRWEDYGKGIFLTRGMIQ